MISRRYVEKSLVSSMKRRGWNRVSGKDKIRFAPEDAATGGAIDVLLRSLHRRIKKLDHLQVASLIEEEVQKAIEDAKSKGGHMKWEDAAEVLYFMLTDLQYADGPTLPLPVPFSRLFRLAPMLHVGAGLRSVSAREYAAWDVAENVVVSRAVHNMLALPLPALEVYDYGVRVIEGRIGGVPASSFMPVLLNLLQLHEVEYTRVYACIPDRDRLHFLPVKKDTDSSALDWFRSFNLSCYTHEMPFRLYEFTGEEWVVRSADVGDSVTKTLGAT